MKRRHFRGLILTRYNAGEADRVLKLLTKDAGLKSIRAKGVRKITSRRGSHLEPLTHISGTAHVSAYGWYLAEVQAEERYAALHQDMGAMLHARVLGYIYTLIFAEDDPQPELYLSMDRAWRLLPQLSRQDRCMLESTMIVTMLKRAGIAPSLDACLQCGARVPKVSFVFDARRGGWQCRHCLPGGSPGIALSADMLPLVTLALYNPWKVFPTRLSYDHAEHLLTALRQYVRTVHGEQLTVAYAT